MRLMDQAGHGPCLVWAARQQGINSVEALRWILWAAGTDASKFLLDNLQADGLGNVAEEDANVAEEDAGVYASQPRRAHRGRAA